MFWICDHQTTLFVEFDGVVFPEIFQPTDGTLLMKERGSRVRISQSIGTVDQKKTREKKIKNIHPFYIIDTVICITKKLD